MSLPAIVQNHLMEDLKAQITSGQLAAGARLPGRLELCARYGVSSVTVQKAVDRLVTEGFLVTQARAGTFVATRLPYLDTIGVVFARPVAEVAQAFYLGTLHRALQTLAAQGTWRLLCYYGIDWHGNRKEEERLRTDLFSQRLAGVLYANLPAHLYQRSWWPKVPVPQLAVSSIAQREPLPTLLPDYASFFAAACQHLRAAGRRRVAVVELGGALDCAALLAPAAAAVGLAHDPCWCQMTSALGVQRCVSLLLSPRLRPRPDALIVADDSLLPGVLAALASLPLHLPRDLSIVSLANFPSPQPAPPFVQRIGFDHTELLHTALALITQAQHGGKLPRLTRWRARAETR